MASITSFEAVANLRVSNPRMPQSGLNSDRGSQSGCGVQGDGLDSMQITVKPTNQSNPVWKGTLGSRGADGWVCDLTCTNTATVDGTIDVGDPEDVTVTVEAGTDLSRRVDATLSDASVKMGPG